MIPTRRGWLVCLATAGLGLAAVGQIKRGEVIYNFRVPDYDEQGAVKSQLEGETAYMLSSDVVEVTNLKIDLYKQGVVETRVTAPQCLYQMSTRSAASKGPIRIARGNIVISGADFIWDAEDQRFFIQTNARVVIRDLPRPSRAPGATR